MLKKTACLLALTLFIPSLQACGHKTAKSDLTEQPATQNQPSPQSNPPQAGETVVPAPSVFNEAFAGMIEDRHAIRMALVRKDAALSGSYYYERAGAFNAAMRTLELKGRIDGDGNVVLSESNPNVETDKSQKTGEFRGRLDAVKVNGEVNLRFSGVWVGGKEKKEAPFNL